MEAVLDFIEGKHGRLEDAIDLIHDWNNAGILFDEILNPCAGVEEQPSSGHACPLVPSGLLRE